MADEVDEIEEHGEDEDDDQEESWQPRVSELEKKQQAESKRFSEFQTKIEDEMADHRAKTERLLKERPPSTPASSPPEPTPPPPEPERKPKPSERKSSESTSSDGPPKSEKPESKFQTVVRRRRSI
jgi:hypothetical protein